MNFNEIKKPKTLDDFGENLLKYYFSLKTSEYIVSEWNSTHSYEDRIELSDVFDYVFEKRFGRL